MTWVATALVPQITTQSLFAISRGSAPASLPVPAPNSSKRKGWISQLIKVVGFYQVDRVYRGISDREDLIILKLTPDSCRIWQAELKKLTRTPALEVG